MGLGSDGSEALAMRLEAAGGLLVQPGCPGMCGGSSGGTGSSAGAELVLVNCSSAGAGGWAPVGGGGRGLYRRPLD